MLHLEQIPGLSITDPDDFGQTATMTLGVTQGAVTVTVGNSGVTITSGNGTSSVVLSGLVSQFNKLIKGLTTGTIVYTSTSNGSKTFTITVTDATGQSGVMSFPILVATSIPPDVTYSGSTVQANQNVTINMHGASKFAVTDSDALASLESMSVTSTDGVISIAVGNSGVQLLSGNGTNAVSLRGTLASLNALLGGTSSGTITFTDASLGSKTFTVMVTDVNSSSDSASATVVVGAPPVVIAPTSGTIAGIQGSGLNLHGAGFDVTDADDAGGTATCVMTATVGTITITVGNSGVTITGGNGTGAVTYTGTITQIHNLLTHTSTTGAIVGNDASIQTGTLTVQVTDSTTRVGSNNAVLKYENSTPTWQGYAQSTPAALATGSITAMPLFIDLSTMPLAWWQKVSTDGRDIRVTDASNANIPRHLLYFDYASKTGFLVSKEDMSTSPGALRIWCGTSLASAPAAGSTYGQNNTYNSNIKAFWPDGAGTDATSNANNLTAQGGLTAANAAGPIGAKSTSYNGTTQYANKTGLVVASAPISLLTYYKSSAASTCALMGEFEPASQKRYALLRLSTGVIEAGGNETSFNRTADTATTGAVGTFAAAAGVLTTGLVTAYDPPNSGASSTAAPGSLQAPTSSPETLAGLTKVNGGTFSFMSGNLSCSMILNIAVTQQFSDVYQAMLNQAAFWGTWAFSTTTITGL